MYIYRLGENPNLNGSKLTNGSPNVYFNFAKYDINNIKISNKQNQSKLPNVLTRLYICMAELMGKFHMEHKLGDSRGEKIVELSVMMKQYIITLRKV